MAQDHVMKVVVIGGSAGSLEIILNTVAQLPTDMNVAYVVIVHRKNEPGSLLPNLLASRTKMKVKEVEDKEMLVPNSIYIAPPDYHLLFESRESFSLESSEKIHYSRPSIDVTFESAAEIFGADAIGVILSGGNADGAEGLKKIKLAGGITIAQNPSTAEVGYMPQQAINLNCIDKIVDPDVLGSVLCNIIKGLA
jgi:two-component system chemotaxis response regulator CheB